MQDEVDEQERGKKRDKTYDEPVQNRQRSRLIVLRIRDLRKQSGVFTPVSWGRSIRQQADLSQPLHSLDRPLKRHHAPRPDAGQRASKREKAHSQGYSVKLTGLRMNGGAVRDDRSPDTEAIDLTKAVHELFCAAGTPSPACSGWLIVISCYRVWV